MPHIGHIKITSPFCQAGLAGYSDRAMRLVARRRGCAYAVTEALLDVILCNGGLGLKKSIDINQEDHPIAGQIMGSEPETMVRAAKIIDNAGYDVVDLNYACPVKKIKNKARGGHMLRDLERGFAIMRQVRDVVPSSKPVTMSLRRSFDSTSESTNMFWQLIEEAWRIGIAAVRVHARTVEQKYQGRADWSILKELKTRYPDKTILGSGDVFTAEDAVRMKLETGVDIVWIARGAIGNPWIFRQAATLLKIEEQTQSANKGNVNSQEALTLVLSQNEREILPPTIAEQRDALEEHFKEAMVVHGEQVASRRNRKMGIKYARFHPEARKVKSAFINVVSLTDWQKVLDEWYQTDGPGVWPAVNAADEVNDDPDLQTCEN